MNIDKLKGSIDNHAGIAKANRFNVMFEPPTSALLNLNRTDIEKNVVNDGDDQSSLKQNPEDIGILCQRAQFPSWNVSTIEYQTNSQVNKFPYTYIHEDLAMSFICTNDYYMKRMFDQWMNSIISIDSHVVNYKSNYVTDIVVQQLNEEMNPVYSYKFYKAFPIIVTAIELDSGSSEFVKLEVTFAYDYFKPDGLASSTPAAVPADAKRKQAIKSNNAISVPPPANVGAAVPPTEKKLTPWEMGMAGGEATQKSISASLKKASGLVRGAI